jgi:hypothetical protein
MSSRFSTQTTRWDDHLLRLLGPRIPETPDLHTLSLLGPASLPEKVDRLCELNVIRQTFHVCTSPIVQAAWDQGQDLAVYGMIYSLSDGLVDTIVGPLTRVNSCHDVLVSFNQEGGVAGAGRRVRKGLTMNA